MDGELHLRVGVLHTQRRAVAAKAAISLDVLLGQPARIDLDGDLRVGGEREDRVDGAAEAVDLGGGKKGRRAATEVQLRDGPCWIEQRLRDRELPAEQVDVESKPDAAPGM